MKLSMNKELSENRLNNIDFTKGFDDISNI